MTESDFQTFEAVGALVVVLDLEGRIVYWNHRCSSLTGYTLEEVRGRSLWDFALVPEDVEAVKAVFAAVRTSERPLPYANYWVTKACERRWHVLSHTLSRHSDGRAQYVIKTGIDRTESKRASDDLRVSEAKLGVRAAEAARLYEHARRVTDDLREANQHLVSATIRAQELTERVEASLAHSEEIERDLRAVAELRETFMGILGHDLRNPLGAIAATAEMLSRSGHLSEENQKRVSRISASSDRMTRMILQLLDFTRARLGGGFPLEPKPTNLRDVCRSLVEEFGEDHIHLEIEGDVSGEWDPDRLAESLSNLSGNAVEHARPGTAVIVRARSEGAEVVVEIINWGDPIPAKVLPFIFEPFRRDSREKSAAGHLGLGLYIANQIVRAAGGKLDAWSADGTTTFAMRLPRHVASVTPSSPQADPRA